MVYHLPGYSGHVNSQSCWVDSHSRPLSRWNTALNRTYTCRPLVSSLGMVAYTGDPCSRAVLKVDNHNIETVARQQIKMLHGNWCKTHNMGQGKALCWFMWTHKHSCTRNWLTDSSQYAVSVRPILYIVCVKTISQFVWAVVMGNSIPLGGLYSSVLTITSVTPDRPFSALISDVILAHFFSRRGFYYNYTS